MARSRSTPGQRARLYLEMHREARTTALPGEHKERREDIMRQLERQDPDVRERALVGGPRHFDRPLTQGEREYQQHWRREEGIDVGDAQRRARLLDNQHEGRRRTPPTAPGGGRRPSPTRPPNRPVQRAQAAARTVRGAQIVSAPAASSGIGQIVTGAFTAGLGLAMVGLVVKNGKAVGTGVNSLTTAFNKLVAPTPLFGSSGSTAATTPVNAYLRTRTSAGGVQITP